MQQVIAPHDQLGLDLILLSLKLVFDNNNICDLDLLPPENQHPLSHPLTFTLLQDLILKINQAKV